MSPAAIITAARLPELYDLLADTRNSFADIGNHFGVTRERIRQLYERDLRVIVGLTGHERTHERTDLSHAALMATGVIPGRAGQAARAARAAGCRVSGVLLAASSLTIASTLLDIDGYLCRVRFCARPFFPSQGLMNGGYWRFNTQERTCAYSIFLCGSRKGSPVFVVPEYELRDDTYIPATPSVGYNNIHPRLDFWRDYLNAWPKAAP